jgi:hypothetical protein
MNDFQFTDIYNIKRLNLLLDLVDQKIFSESVANSFFKLWLDDELNYDFFAELIGTVIFIYDLIFDGKYETQGDFDFDTYPFSFALIIEAMNHNQNIKQAKIEIFNETIKNLIYASKEWG